MRNMSAISISQNRTTQHKYLHAIFITTLVYEVCKVMRNPLLKKSTLSTKPGGRIILKSSQGKYQKCILAAMKLSNTRNDVAHL
jgi:hypothetical protein